MVLRSRDVSDCTTICALSQRSTVPRPLASVNKTASPVGNICGPYAVSSFSSLTICSNLPPFGETTKIPLDPRPNTIPRSPQLIPLGRSDCTIVVGEPPLNGIRLIVLSDVEWNAIQRLSGEN